MRSMPTGGAQTVKQTRRIIHIDMDAFCASVEQYDYLAYRGRVP